MPSKRIPFLPLFLVVLAIIFVVAVAIRARTYATADAQKADARVVEQTAALDPNAREPHSEQTGTLVPLPNDSTPPGGASGASSPAGGFSTSASVSRAQRLRELLSRPLSSVSTPAPNPAPIKQPVVQPPPPRVQPPQKPVAPIQRIPNPGGINSSSQPPNSNPRGRGDDGDKNPRDPNDPTSDTKPPQLVSVFFDPPQVHDGEEGVLWVMATDDISGVRGISGTVTSPSSKALQGFSCQKDPEVPNRWSGRVLIPKDAEEGTWRVNFMSLSDNASNTANLHYSSGGIPPTAVLRVISNRPDNTPPTLRRVWVERRQMKAGERNNIFIEADDDKSGVKFASGVFLSPSKFARLSFGCQKGEIETQWNCVLSTPVTLDCGDWQLEQVQLQDGANNMATIRQDNPIVGQVKVGIMGDACDNTPPVLQSLTVEPRVVSNQQGSTVTVTAMVTDDQSGMYGVMAQAVGPGTGSGRWFPLAASADNPAMWIGRFEIPTAAGKGLWRISFVQVIDKANNLRLYTQNDPQLANATFEVR